MFENVNSTLIKGRFCYGLGLYFIHGTKFFCLVRNHLVSPCIFLTTVARYFINYVTLAVILWPYFYDAEGRVDYIAIKPSDKDTSRWQNSDTAEEDRSSRWKKINNNQGKTMTVFLEKRNPEKTYWLSVSGKHEKPVELKADHVQTSGNRFILEHDGGMLMNHSTQWKPLNLHSWEWDYNSSWVEEQAPKFWLVLMQCYVPEFGGNDKQDQHCNASQHYT